jgi:hypothetical protein
MDLDVLQERHLDAASPRVPLDNGEHEQRRPHEQREHGDAPLQQLLRVDAREARASPQLVERPTEDQREVGRGLGERILGGVARAHRWRFPDGLSALRRPFALRGRRTTGGYLRGRPA